MSDEILSISDVADSEVQLAVFFIDEERYAIDIMKIKEIVKPMKTTPLPDVPDFIKGVINLRGVVLPVISMRERFGLSHEETEESRIIIIGLKKITVGILVDAIEEVITIPLKDVKLPPKIAKGVDSTYLKGICRLGEDVLVLLDLDKILTSVEKVMVDELKKKDSYR
ncbi:MAG: purine-binding chemotaxis protein CheW [Proteobacteria bacterium]|nr:purine-binding chemotaxis protein CheW [Pseudomonadota bacterium]